MDGIDVSEFQSDAQLQGSWLFVVHKATERVGQIDSKFQARYPSLPGLRGAYHYARPTLSDGTKQADFFANVCLAAGFKPNVDLWQLDAEDGLNAGAVWLPFIEPFMARATARLGSRGFLYAGWPFLVAHGLQALVNQYHWWLPDYSINDGVVHPIQAPGNPVLHQYTSHGNLDRNVVHDQAAWNQIVASPPQAQETELMLIKAPDWQQKDPNRPAAVHLDLAGRKIDLMNGATIKESNIIPSTTDLVGWYEVPGVGFAVMARNLGDGSGNPKFGFHWTDKP